MVKAPLWAGTHSSYSVPLALSWQGLTLSIWLGAMFAGSSPVSQSRASGSRFGAGIAENYILLTYKNKLAKCNLSKHLIYHVNFQVSWKETNFCRCFVTVNMGKNLHITMYFWKTISHNDGSPGLLCGHSIVPFTFIPSEPVIFTFK